MRRRPQRAGKPALRLLGQIAGRKTLPAVLAIVIGGTLAVDLGVVSGKAHYFGASAQAADFTSARFVADAARISTDVAPLTIQHEPDLMYAADQAFPQAAVAAMSQLPGVQGVELAGGAQVMIQGKRVGVLSVDPSVFRQYTPGPTAKSDQLWHNIAAGEVAISFDLHQNGGLQLGAPVTATGTHQAVRLNVGAFATMGIPEIDAVVSQQVGGLIGMPTGNVMVVSAPKANLSQLNTKIMKLLPKGTRSDTLKQSALTIPNQPPGLGAHGQLMNSTQVRTVIAAAESQLGVPYVWGGEAPGRGFDCSGLVQWAYGKAGISMPRTADVQVFAGWRIPLSQAQPGDLLGWTNDPTIPGVVSHIAIYYGGGWMLVAPHTGDNVRFERVYLSNFWGAVRVDPQQASKIAGD